MKSIKILLLILTFFFMGGIIVSADTGTGNTTVTVDVPVPTNLSTSCNASGDQATISWTMPSGYTKFLTRAFSNGAFVFAEETIGSFKSFPVLAGQDYDTWIHTEGADGSLSLSVHFANINCVPKPICTPPTTDTQTISCSSRNGAWVGSINQSNTKDTYPNGCGWLGWIDVSNTCSCSAPATQDITGITCDLNSYGYAAISGSVTRRQTKGAYSDCSFPTLPVTVSNSTYVSDNCVYNPVVNGVCGSSNGMSFYVSPTSGYCSTGTPSSISGSGPWTWSCNGSNGGTNSGSCSANKVVDGGWSSWSAKDPTPGYSGTQTRTCTNPTPAYGGANCVGSSTQAYTNTPATPTGFGAAPSSCGNNWLNLWWNTSSGSTNYKVYRDGSATPIYDSNGTSFSDTVVLGTYHTYVVNASNASGTSANSSSVGATASNACNTTPDLKVTAWSGSNSDGPIETYSGDVYTLSWAAVANAASCTLDSLSASVSGGSKTASATSLTKTHTLTCTNATGQIASDSLTITIPPPPTSISKVCNVAGNQVTLNWTLPPGYTGGYVRPSEPFYVDVFSGLTTTVAITPGQTYSGIYLHTRNSSNGAWSNIIKLPDFSCVPPPISVSISASPTSMTLPTSTTRLTWTITGTPDSCTASNYWSGAKSTASGSYEDRTGMTAGTYNFVITCSKVGTADASSNVNVTVIPAIPTVTVSSPTSNQAYVPFTVSWSSTNATSVTTSSFSPSGCSFTGAIGSSELSGSRSVTCTTTGSKTFSMTVQNSIAVTASSSSSTNITAVPAISVSISASPTGPLIAPGSTTLSWTTTGTPDSCTASNYWSGTKTASGGSEVRSGMANGTSNFIITCSKLGTADASSNVSVLVNATPTVISPTVTGVTINSATLGANVTSLGYPASISARGTCYGTSANPSLINGATCLSASGTTTGVFTHSRIGLVPGTFYYYRGYGTNTTGTGYSTDGTFTTLAVTVSVVASPTSYNTIPSTNVSILYTPTTNTGTTECRLLDNTSTPLQPTTYTSGSSITVTPPVASGAYGYYVQCRNKVYTTVTATSSLVTVTVFIVTSTASPVTYNVAPGAAVNFTYTPTSNPSGATECLLLDNSLSPISVYKLASPISYTVPNSIGGYGYYVKCRNTVTTIAMANSAKITVNTACGVGTSWNGTACVLPSGTLIPKNCKITAGNGSCDADIDWTVVNPVGIPTAITASSMADINVTNTLTTPQSGTKSVNVPYPSKLFYLYNNGNLLAQATENAICTDTPTQTFWDGISKCVTPTGTLSTGGCSIKAGNSSCNDAKLDWTVTNPIGDSRVDADYGGTVVLPTPAILGNAALFSLDYNKEKTLSLFSGSFKIKEIKTTAFCAPKTMWDGSICLLNPPKIDNFTVLPSTIFKGRSATISWMSDPELVTSCTGTSLPSGLFDTKGLISGSIPVSPITTTTFTLTCKRGNTSTVPQSKTTKVIILNIKEQ